MSGLQSLLKYRYQRRSDCQASGNGSVSRPIEVPSDSSTIPDSPESSNSKSPIFHKRPTVMAAKSPPKRATLTAKRGAIVIQSSDSEADSPVKSMKSPWLSKENGVQSLSGQNNPSVDRPAASSSEWSTVDRECVARFNTLREMFPAANKEYLQRMAESTTDVEEAIDRVIASHTVRASSTQRPAAKRKRIIRSNSSGSEGDGPVAKSRFVDEASEGAEPQPQASAENGTAENKVVDEASVQSKVTFLQEALPNVPAEVLKSTLIANDMDEEKTTLALLNYIPPQGPVDQTQNVGSIKAYQLQRQQARLAGQVPQKSADSDLDEMDEDFGGGGRKRRKARMADDSDDDSDEDIANDEMDDQLLAFLNDASAEELVCVKGCSARKAESLIQMRPYQNWEDLAAKFEHCPQGPLPFSLITECKDVLRVRKALHHLMKQCERLSGDLEKVVGALASKVTLADEDVDCITCQPSSLNPAMHLAPYQLVGLNWLALMFRKNLDGILGDEMGLGKTVQTIAFLAHLLETGHKGPHIVIAPASTIDNWLRELRLWCPALHVLLYYGPQDERRDLRAQVLDGSIGTFHVLLTTYTIATGSAEDRALFRKLKYHYAVFDEGHMLKNMQSMRYQSLMRIRASRRLLLTGTPLQNNLIELLSLLAFAMPDMFVDQADQLKRIFQTITKRSNNESRGAYEKEVIIHAKSILRPFFLRRLKTQVLQCLPSKNSLIEKVAMSKDQQVLYDDLKHQFSCRLNEAGESGASMLMQLRKAANHQLLHRRLYTDQRLREMAQRLVKEPSHCEADPDLVLEDMQIMSDFELHRLCCQHKGIGQYKLNEDHVLDSGKFRRLDELFAELKAQSARVLLFSQFTMMMDILESYLKLRGHRWFRLDGSTPVAERQELIDRFNEDHEIFVFLLSTKAGGLGINLTAANTVILHDIDFNPYNDKQAEDRCHRVGQTREVTVYRLISRGSVEEAMLTCAQSKLHLEEDVTGQSNDQDDADSRDVATLLRSALKA